MSLKGTTLRIIDRNYSPQAPHCDLSPNGPFLRPIATLSGQPQFEQCHTPLIIFALCPSANSRSFASFSSSLWRFAVIGPWFAFDCGAEGVAGTDAGKGASPSMGGWNTELSTTVDGVGEVTFARGLRIELGYDGALNDPRGLGTFDVGSTGAAGIGFTGGSMVVPFSDATMFAIVKEAAAAAARRDVGAAAAAAIASVEGSISGNPIAGVRCVLIGSLSGSTIPRRPRVLRFRRLFASFSRSLSSRSSSPSLR